MKKVELVEAVAEKAGLTKADATRAIDAFSVSKRAAREGRNPRTGETVTIAARNAVSFKAGSALKDAVN